MSCLERRAAGPRSRRRPPRSRRRRGARRSRARSAATRRSGLRRRATRPRPPRRSPTRSPTAASGGTTESTTSASRSSDASAPTSSSPASAASRRVRALRPSSATITRDAASSEPRAEGAAHCPGRDDADDLHAPTDIRPRSAGTRSSASSLSTRQTRCCSLGISYPRRRSLRRRLETAGRPALSRSKGSTGRQRAHRAAPSLDSGTGKGPFARALLVTFVESVSLSSTSSRRCSVGSSYDLVGGASSYSRSGLSALPMLPQGLRRRIRDFADSADAHHDPYVSLLASRSAPA